MYNETNNDLTFHLRSIDFQFEIKTTNKLSINLRMSPKLIILL